MSQKNIKWDKNLIRQILSEAKIKWDKYQVNQILSIIKLTKIQVEQKPGETNTKWHQPIGTNTM